MSSLRIATDRHDEQPRQTAPLPFWISYLSAAAVTRASRLTVREALAYR